MPKEPEMELRPASAIRIYDYTPDPRVLLDALREPVRQLRSFVKPMISLRRGWLHGSHLQVTVRPHGTAPDLELASFVADAALAARALPAVSPTEASYLAGAEQLAAWENVSAPFLPLHPQGFVEAGPATAPPTWSAELELARDLIGTEFVEAILGSTSAQLDVTQFAARILAFVARTHPYGLGLGTLSYRSHAEGISATVRDRTDLNAVFARRFARDREVFTAALTEPDPAPQDPLAAWAGPLHRAWGVAEALAATGAIDGPAIDAAGRLDRLPVERAQVSDFHATYSTVGLAGQKPHWFTAHRIVLNTVYPALMCLGLSALQRYYVCYGLAEATDLLLEDPWQDRLGRLGSTVASLPA
jgi:hypothetical protein